MAAAAQNYDDEDRLDLMFHALADRTRRALLSRLSQGPARVTDLAQPFAMTLAAVSKHIRVLEGAGLVARAVDGRVHRCSLNAAPLQDLAGWLQYYRAYWDDTLSAIARYVESGEDGDGKP